MFLNNRSTHDRFSHLVSFRRNLVFVLALLIFLAMPVVFFQRHQIWAGLTEGWARIVHGTPTISLDDKENRGGLINLASTDEPTIRVSSWQLAGPTQFTLYRANEEVLFKYLQYNKDGKQSGGAIDVSQLTQVTTFNQPIYTGFDAAARVSLPLEETGIWYLQMMVNGSTLRDLMIVRSQIGLVAKEGDNQFIFWAQDFRTNRKFTQGTVSLYQLKDQRTELGSTTVDGQGISTLPLRSEADIAVLRGDGNFAVVPLNMRYLNTDYSTYQYFRPKETQYKFFSFTDRPLYLPGDTVNFKAVLRDDDDARYSLPTGTVRVKIFKDGDHEHPLFQQNLPVSDQGSVSGSYSLMKDAGPGYYSVTFEANPIEAEDPDRYWTWQSSASFQVEHYRKPEYDLNMEVEGFEYIRGDSIPVELSGAFFSGQPLANQELTYSVKSSDYYEYEYFVEQSSKPDDRYRYGYWGNSKELKKDTFGLNAQGAGTLAIDTASFETDGKTKIITVEAYFLDASQNPVMARKNLILYPGRLSVYRQQESSYQGKVGEIYTLPLHLKSKREDSVSNKNVEVKIQRDTWVPYIDETQKYTQYRKETHEYPAQTVTTDASGNVSIQITPDREGYYRFATEVKDSLNNPIRKEFGAWMSNRDVPLYTSQNSSIFSLTADRDRYKPGETVKLTLTSAVPNMDALLAVQRGRVDRYQIVSFTGGNATVNLPLDVDDMPNVFVRLSGFSGGGFDSSSVKVPVSADQKQLKVELSSEKAMYGPGETIELNVKTSDLNGNPVPAEVAVWSVDKALYELAENQLQDIFTTFWSDRWESTEESHSLEGINAYNGAEQGGGCFTSETQILMADGKTKSIKQVKKGDWVLTRESEQSSILTKAKVTGTHQVEESGYLIINQHLEITPQHKLWVNDTWQTANQIQVGDRLLDQSGNEVTVSSLEWIRKQVPVYNLSIEKHHTFFANGIWVHNQKGDLRQRFEDVAYWNPVVRTDQNGQAQVRFTLPDNLTTWVMAGVGATTDTIVGQTTLEVKVQKDIVVRPVLPNILRVGDQAELSAIVHNFTDETQTFDIDFSFTGGEIEEDAQRQIEVGAQASQQLFWDVNVTKESEQAEVKISAKSQSRPENIDTIISTLPVQKFGYLQRTAQVGEGGTDFKIDLAPDTDLQKSSVKLLLSSSLVGSLPESMQYLVRYPYGCVEQTTSRFIPALLAKKYPEYAETLENKNVDAMIQEGLRLLLEKRLGSGGWNWWGHSAAADPFVTAYVVDALTMAKSLGYEVSDKAYFFGDTGSYNFVNQFSNGGKTVTVNTSEVQILRYYIYTLLGKSENPRPFDSNSLSTLSPDVVAYYVMASVKNGDNDPQSNGLQVLLNMRKTEGQQSYWEAGPKFRFGSREASTALAIRAILAANGDRTIASDAVRFLLRNQKQVYWGNTFGTSQSLLALSEFGHTGNEQSPQYTYQVNLDQNQIKEGKVDATEKWIPTIQVPLDQIGADGSTLSLNQVGDGQLYSVLVKEEFRTEPISKPFGNEVLITRKYVSDRGEQYSLAVGDVVTVTLQVYGMDTDQNYAMIRDHLPAGLIPINTAFKNEEFNDMNPSYSYNVEKREFLSDGLTISLYELRTGSHTFTYKARVISAGEFQAPPASVELMYSPEIYAYSASDQVSITGTPKVILSKAVGLALTRWSDRIWDFFRSIFNSPLAILSGVALGLFFAGGVLILKRKNKLTGLRSLLKRHPELPTDKPEDQNEKNFPT